MKEQSNGIKLSAAVVSDRGLSKKRPLNEDSFLSDPERRIFAVADGVGGAQAGEVASQTAMEVLDEAFRHIEPGADVEDLLEIAIQRANSSIHSMSREHPKLSMMATTIVVLHLDGHIATIGHVGDSRLYRISPDGQLHRETADHSVVEEEVRAGRMTPEQASNHPSRNVISRALGAEETVEVDLKTMEIDDGTSFLLCSDGITRHIPDAEIREILTSETDLDAICEEMKRRCYERGAEDNLTAVIVRVGDAVQASAMDDERTRVSERPHLAATMSGDAIDVAPATSSAAVSDAELHDTVDAPAKPGALRTPAPAKAVDTPATELVAPIAAAPPRRRSAFRSLLRAIAFLLLLGIVGTAAFIGGMYYHLEKPDTIQSETPPATQPTASSPAQKSLFDQERAKVDENPKDWLDKNSKQPAGIDEVEFLYLSGRAQLLMGNYPEADKALKASLSKLQAGNPLKYDATMAEVIAAAGLSKTYSTKTVQNALTDLEKLSPQAKAPDNASQQKSSMGPAGARPPGGMNKQGAPPIQPPQ